jgi:hypothetical protein
MPLERTVSHDAMWDAFASIMKDVCFHVACEQTHILLPPTIQSSYQWVDIVLSVDGIHMLANVIIVASIRVDLVSHVVLFWEMPTMVAIRAKKGFYQDQTCLSFLPLRYLGVYINKLIIFFIIVLICHELQRALEAFLF